MAYMTNAWGEQAVGYEVERMSYQIRQDRCVYFSKKAYETAMKLLKKVNVTGTKIVDDWVPYLQIDYETSTRCPGRMCFYDIGPRPPKPKKEIKPKPEKKPKNREAEKR